jgi:uracil-DNA glycosylase
VGLAPGAHGANRTGRVFTGDRSGDWLYRALYRAGFANQAESRRQNDGLTLRDAWVSCVVRCAPPDNRPSREEILRCSGHLSQELRLLKNAQVFIALGAVALEGLWPILTSASPAKGSPRPKFRHGEILSLSHPDKAGGMPFSGVRSRTLLLSYHPSQQNTFTGKLTEAMFDSIFSEAKKILGSTPKS